MKISVALHADGHESKVYLLKPWKRSSSGFLWKMVFDGPISDCERVANGLAKFLRTPVLDATQISKPKPQVASIIP